MEFPFLSFLFSFSVGGASLFTLIILLMFAIGGSTGVILGNAVSDIALRDTYYVVAHYHCVLSLPDVIAIFSGILYFQEKYRERIHRRRRAIDIILL